MAVSLPKGGEMNLITRPDSRYHKVTIPGPAHPTNSDNFFENKMISRVGLVKLE